MHACPAGQLKVAWQAPHWAVTTFTQTRAPLMAWSGTHPAGQAAQALFAQSVPLQQSASLVQAWPTAPQCWQVPPAPQMRPAQQSLSAAQVLPAPWHGQTPRAPQVPLQHSRAPGRHGPPGLWHGRQEPPVQARPAQQALVAVQAPPKSTHPEPLPSPPTH